MVCAFSRGLRDLYTHKADAREILRCG